MAVFTAIGDRQRATLAAAYSLPETLRTEGIATGVENTNYRVYAAAQPEPQWVLTLLEKPTDLAFVLAVLAEAHAAGLPVPLPLATREGDRTLILDGRTALLMPYIAGSHLHEPEPSHCAAIGAFVGRLHRQVAAGHTSRSDPQGLDWLLPTARQVLGADSLATDTCTLLERHASELLALPERTCHGDLFRDNALFTGHQLSGVIDWYNAARAPAAFDVAILLNDWCTDDHGQLLPEHTRALMGAYQSEHLLPEAAIRQMPLLRAWAALRFWTSRVMSTQAMQTVAAGSAIYRGKAPGEQRDILLRAVDPAAPGHWLECCW